MGPHNKSHFLSLMLGGGGQHFISMELKQRNGATQLLGCDGGLEFSSKWGAFFHIWWAFFLHQRPCDFCMKSRQLCVLGRYSNVCTDTAPALSIFSKPRPSL